MPRATLLSILCILPLLSIACASQPPIPPRTIQSVGVASVHVKPDEVEFRFQIHAFDSDLAKSKTLNDDACKKVIQFVKSLGVEDRDIQTQAMRTEKVYDEPRDQPRVFKGYTVQHDYDVRLRDVSKFEQLGDILLTREDCSIQRYDFSTSKLRELRDEARKNAIHAAREKAMLLAAELNCRIGPPITIAENSIGDWRGMAQSNSNHDVVFAGGSGDSPTAPVGEIEVQASIDVVFKLIGR